MLGLAIAAGRPAAAQHQPVDTLSDLQSIYSFNPLFDGQPNTPNAIELQLTVSRSEVLATPDAVLILPQLNYTPRGGALARNALFSVVGLFDAGVSGLNADNLILLWQQRWIADVPRLLSVASVLFLVVPGGLVGEASGVGGGIAGVVAKSFETTTLYLNAGINYRAFVAAGSWSAAAGFRSPVGGRAALTASYQYFDIAGELPQRTINLSVEYWFSDRFIVGPGFLVGLGNLESTPSWGLGVLSTWEL